MVLPELRQRCGRGHDPSMIPMQQLEQHKPPFQRRANPRYIYPTHQHTPEFHSDLVDRAGRYVAAADSLMYTGAPKNRNPWAKVEWCRDKALYKANHDYPIKPLFPDSKTWRAPNHMGSLPPDRIAGHHGAHSYNMVHMDPRPSAEIMKGTSNAVAKIVKVNGGMDIVQRRAFLMPRDQHLEAGFSGDGLRVKVVRGGDYHEGNAIFEHPTTRDSGKLLAQHRSLEVNVAGLHGRDYLQSSNVADDSKDGRDQSTMVRAVPGRLRYLGHTDVTDDSKDGVQMTAHIGGEVTNMADRGHGFLRPSPGGIKFRYTSTPYTAGTKVISHNAIPAIHQKPRLREGHQAGKLTAKVDATAQPTGWIQSAHVSHQFNMKQRKAGERRAALLTGAGALNASQFANSIHDC